MQPPSVFDHRRSSLQEYAKSQLPVQFSFIGKYVVKLKQFKKKGARQSGKFCLLCFIEEIDKLQVTNANVDVFTDEEDKAHVAKIMDAISKAYGASWGAAVNANKHGRKHVGSQLKLDHLFIKSVGDLLTYWAMYHLGILENSDGATSVARLNANITFENVTTWWSTKSGKQGYHKD